MKNALILFFKYPQKGAVKTRLAAELGDNFVYGLYCHFISDLLNTCKSVDADIVLALDRVDINDYSKYTLIKQRGADIGEKMYNAFADVFAMQHETQRAVLIGSDIPDIDNKLLNNAFAQLAQKSIVLGPSEDGGYYLIGFQREALSSDVFMGIPWSSSDTCAMTLSRITGIADLYGLLDKLNDIDTLEDLKSFYEKNKSKKNVSAAVKFLSENEEMLYDKI